ncbi:type II secretion system minor pseudopilin GspI [Maricaulaceae bacterium EIL42A08]|nr:type II secretion system minor pseudopilin GspI [Maricaulaceae bacterium EIL42A08]MCP2679300.1 type II secretion system minor pseudopilin GspI [Maricaulaceae bacterium NA33B04]
MTGRTEGFSLVEMLAALSILAVAGVALTNAMTSSVRAASQARDISLAGVAADNVMALNLASDQGQDLRARSGTYELAGTEYDWTLALEETPDPQLTRVTVTIERDEREQARRVTFVRARS